MKQNYLIKKNGSPTEHSIQCNVARYIDLQYPNVLWSASSGGMRVRPKTAFMNKRAGYKAGCPDIILYEARGIFHGLHLELKAKGGKQSPAQIEWMNKAEGRGYLYKLAYDFDQAKEILDLYLKEVK